MPIFDRYDELDRLLVHALHIDGRAPLSKLAAVLGVSDKTIARRYVRLRASGALRVVGVFDPSTLDQVVWFLRVRCVPSAAEAIADSLARRPDTTWVSLTSAGTEITCMVQVSDPADGDTLLRRLPRAARVESVTAHYVLHGFVAPSDTLVMKLGHLDPAQIEALRPALTRTPTRLTLDPTDHTLLTALSTDGRTPLTDLATATGRPESAIRRRLHALRAAGALTYEVEFDWRLLGLAVRALLWLTCAPTETRPLGEALATHPEVAFVAATTGPTNLLASILCPDHTALYTYLTERLADTSGIQRIETAPILRTVKRIAYPPLRL
ncbi:Lrp/AsnC family transcriptional regulator [Nocardia heshunensis]